MHQGVSMETGAKGEKLVVVESGEEEGSWNRSPAS